MNHFVHPLLNILHLIILFNKFNRVNSLKINLNHTLLILTIYGHLKFYHPPKLILLNYQTVMKRVDKSFFKQSYRKILEIMKSLLKKRKKKFINNRLNKKITNKRIKLPLKKLIMKRKRKMIKKIYQKKMTSILIRIFHFSQILILTHTCIHLKSLYLIFLLELCPNLIQFNTCITISSLGIQTKWLWFQWFIPRQCRCQSIIIHI